jgi:hypothetical protein
MKYDIIADQQNKIYQHYPVRLTKYMTKPRLESFVDSFTGYRRADIMIKKDKTGRLQAIFIKRQNRLRRKEDKDLLEQLHTAMKMNFSDFLFSRMHLKREGISIFKCIEKSL